MFSIRSISASKKLVPSGNILPLDAKKIKEFDNITPVFTKGELPNGKKDRRTRAPHRRRSCSSTRELDDLRHWRHGVWVTLIPTVYNADTLGIRPDTSSGRSSPVLNC